jgi:hypothetical protein
MPPTLDQLTVADAPEAWAACGFEVAGGESILGGVGLRFAGTDAGRGIVAWSLRDLAGDGSDLDGLRTEPSTRAPSADPPSHPNGITAVDHVVAISPDLDRTVAALVGAGLDLRRVREEPTPAGAPRQAFFLLGGAILEVVQEPEDVVEKSGGPDRPAFFWGLALLAPDLDATVAFLGEGVGEARDAVQPGRRIATLRRAAGLAVAVALITPRPEVG